MSKQEFLTCYFVSDLHGRIEQYQKLFKQLIEEPPHALFIGGDLLPSPLTAFTAVPLNISHTDFIQRFLVKELKKVQEILGNSYPRIFVIMGNDDGRMEEASMLDAASQGIWEYCHNRRINWKGFSVYGYSFVPPTPFLIKDWERYDVSRYVDPGCIPPEEGIHSVLLSEYELNCATIAEDLEKLTGGDDLESAIFLFHAPPYNSKLDRAALDGKTINYVPLDVHVGSIAIQRFIEKRRPLITLHGHIHESTRITGLWRDKFNCTESFNGAHDGPELSIIRFDPYSPSKASRQLI